MIRNRHANDWPPPFFGHIDGEDEVALTDYVAKVSGANGEMLINKVCGLLGRA